MRFAAVALFAGAVMAHGGYEDAPPAESTDYVTEVHTITDCPDSVTDCPAHHTPTSVPESDSSSLYESSSSSYETTSVVPSPPVETTPTLPYPPPSHGNDSVPITNVTPPPPGHSSPGPCASLSIETITTTTFVAGTAVPTVVYETHEVVCTADSPGTTFVPIVSKPPTLSPSSPGYPGNGTTPPVPTSPPVGGAAAIGASVVLAAIAGVVALVV